MSWEERIKNGITITTGDGKMYTPFYYDSPVSEDFNVAEFMFPLIAGTLVKKSETKGTRYTLEFFFQGADCLDFYEEFRVSARDKRPWVVIHPIHGTITCQVPSITYDTTSLNITKITATLIETITEDAPKSSIGVKNQIALDVENFSEVSSESFESRLKDGSKSFNSLNVNLDDNYSAAQSIKKSELQANEYFNLFKKAESALLTVTSKPLLAIQALRDVINYPSFFETTVRTRLDLLKNQFDILSSGIQNLITPDDKLIYENNAGNVIAAMVLAISNPLDQNDYANATDVFNVVDLLIISFNEYQSNLDSLQTDNGASTDSYIPDFDSNNSLTALVNFAIANLFEIAIGAKQERKVILGADSNFIVLTHQFLGLVEDDSTIDEFIRNNNIGLSELAQIKKGREIIYYV